MKQLVSEQKCSIRHITAEVGAAVLRAAVTDDIAEGHGDVGPKDLGHMSKVLSNSDLFVSKHV